MTKEEMLQLGRGGIVTLDGQKVNVAFLKSRMRVPDRVSNQYVCVYMYLTLCICLSVCLV